jgi:hypothetical protein
MELASNWYRTRAHYSVDLQPARYGEGREGDALCSGLNMAVFVYDKAAHEDHERRFSLTPKPIEALPLCKKCERAAKKLTVAGGSDRSDPLT